MGKGDRTKYYPVYKATNMAGGSNRTYAQVVREKDIYQNQGRGKRNKALFVHKEYNIEAEDLVRFKRAYVGEVENLGMTYNL